MVQYVPAIVSNRQPNPRWLHVGHSTSYNEGLPVSVYSLSVLSVPAIDIKDSEELLLSLTHLSILHALASTTPLTRSQSRAGFFFHILTAAAFSCPLLLRSSSIGRLLAAWFVFAS